MSFFQQLIEFTLGRRTEFETAPDRTVWENLYIVSRIQSILGISFKPFEALGGEQKMPLGIYTKWALAYEKITGHNRRQIECCARLSELFASAGIRTCLLKGQAAALYYPSPLQRQSGDIDIWVDAGRDETVNFLRSKGYEVRKIVYHHCDVDIFQDCSVEVHFTPSWMNSFIANMKLQTYIRKNSDAQFDNFNPTLGISVPTSRFNIVYQLIHIFRHLLEEGVGLRHFYDYYYLLESVDETSLKEAREDIGRLGMDRFASAVMYVLKKMFGLEEDRFLFEPSQRLGESLIGEMIRGGDFGRYDSRNSHSENEGVIGHGLRKFKRLSRFGGDYFREVFSAPAFMLWHYLWRKKNNYLYKGR